MIQFDLNIVFVKSKSHFLVLFANPIKLNILTSHYFQWLILGKFGAAAAFALIYLYTAELYPTEIRGTALGLCCMFARIGGFLAPQVICNIEGGIQIYSESSMRCGHLRVTT